MDRGLVTKLDNNDVSTKAILGSLLEGVVIVDRKRTIVYANRAAVKMLGADADVLIGSGYDLSFFNRRKTDAELEVCPINFAITEGTASHMRDEVFVRNDGTDFFVEYVCTPLGDDNRILISFQDVSQRREADRAVADARDAALEAARMKAAFLANISHEIRTPLSGIVGTANLLAETALSPEQANYVEMLKQSIGSLLETVNDILDFSKIEAGKLRLHMTTFDLHELVEDAMTLFRSSAEAKGLSFESVFDPAVAVSYRGDPGRLRQILNNLVSNAIKFTGAGSVKVEVTRVGSGTDRIKFEISDTGIGISEEQLPALFQPFTQGDVSTTRRFGGTGLGLAISRELAEMMNGEIGVESEIGRGSRFWFTVSLTPAIEPEPIESIHISESPADRFHVLLAEDHPISAEIIKRMLEQSGCRVSVAANGRNAAEIAGNYRFDLILMDCQMPEIDGYEATGLIRNSSGPNRSAKIIALSAHAEEIERSKCLLAGLDDFLCKPLTRESLARMFETHFKDSFTILNLDLSPNLIHHFLAKHVTPEVSENFLSIEARGEKDFVREILGTYFEYSEAELGRLESDLRNRDLVKLNRRAHALKGSSANVGLESIRRICGEIELADDFEMAGIRLTVLKREFSKIKEEFLKL